MRGSAWIALMFALACGDDDDTHRSTDASTALDGSRPGLDAALIQKCGPLPACQSGALTQLPEVCIGSLTGQPSGDSWRVCAVDPQGHAAYVQLRADEHITSAGWTHSNYGFVDSTLDDDGVDACLSERSKLHTPSADDRPDAADQLCFRAGSGNGDE